jgi:hypothetical protein
MMNFIRFDSASDAAIRAILLKETNVASISFE